MEEKELKVPEKDSRDEGKIAGFDQKEAREIVLDTIGEQDEIKESKKDASLNFDILENIQKAGEKKDEPEIKRDNSKDIERFKNEFKKELKGTENETKKEAPEKKENDLIKEKSIPEDSTKEKKHIEKKIEQKIVSVSKKKHNYAINFKKIFKEIKNKKITNDIVYLILLIGVVLLIGYFSFFLFVV